MPARKRMFLPGDPNIAVCPWNYNACALPVGRDCEFKPKIEAAGTQAAWISAVSKTHGCQHMSVVLDLSQYNARKIGKLL